MGGQRRLRAIRRGRQNRQRQTTKYLHNHRLPMVGAQITDTDSGRQLMLYGFVATDFGKDDAVAKSQKLLARLSISLLNHIASIRN